MEGDPWAPIEAELLQRRDAVATQQFCEQVRRRGIAVLRVSEEEAALFGRCVAGARDYFCDTPTSAKHEQRMGDDGERDWGYVEMAEVKEFWQMRLNAPDPVPWPELAREYFRCNSRLCRVALAALARGLETDEAHLVDEMMDAEDAPGLSSTIFRFFRYYGGAAQDTRQMGCLTHTDIGLITLIPCSSSPALERLDLDDYRWRAAEAGLGPRDVLVLCGETLERLSGFHYPAVVHRVQRVLGPDRFSLVFLLRARPDAMLDPRALRSPLLEGALPRECGEPVSVARFMRDKYLQKKSANFNAGQGMPLANLRGEQIGVAELEKWKESASEDSKDVY
jgi:hypothetical protein